MKSDSMLLGTIAKTVTDKIDKEALVKSHNEAMIKSHNE